MIRGWLQYLGPVTKDELVEILRLDASEVEKTLLKLESTGLILRGHFRATNQLEWCDRRLLARIHALTLGILRREIEPVTATQFMNWLFTWQHLAPGSQLRGEHGLLEVIKQLQGFEIPANAWEKLIFAKRIKDYDKDWLDHLCFTGVIGWGRVSPHPAMSVTLDEEAQFKRILPTSVTPITFFVREDAAWMAGIPQVNPSDLQVLSHTAQSIYRFLKENGASFFIDIVEGVGDLKTQVEIGLWELVAAGLITADAFDNLRALIDPHRRSGRRGHRLNHRPAAGRWSLLKAKKSASPTPSIEAICTMLLKRYGVCFRELLVKEKIAPSWRDLLTAFRRMEAKGEIRGGRFVSGFAGEQFALPYAVESLRAFKGKQVQEDSFDFSAVDPLNLVGLIVPGKKIPALSKNQVTIKHSPQ